MLLQPIIQLRDLARDKVKSLFVILTSILKIYIDFDDFTIIPQKSINSFLFGKVGYNGRDTSYTVQTEQNTQSVRSVVIQNDRAVLH
jgi:hypothetical protein